MYASETWSTTAKDEDRLSAFLNLCLLRIIGKTRLDRIRNTHLDNRVDILDIRTLLTRKRLTFLVNINRETMEHKL